MIIAATLFVCCNVLMAAIHAQMIAEGKKIRHGWWTAGYVAVAGVLSYLAGQRDGIFFNWWMLTNAVCIRAAIFNLCLNKFRKIPWDYITPELKNVVSLWDAIRKGKTVDYIHYQIFGKNVLLQYTLYAAAAITITITSSTQ